MGQAITYVCGSKEAALEAAEKTPAAAASSSAGASIFQGVAMAPPDPILGLATLYREDTDPKKINLGIGAYRTEKGAPWVLPSVRAAEQSLAKDVLAAKLDKEYLPIDGPPDYKKPVQELLFAPSSVSAGRIATTQALSGTGALRVVANFLVENLGTNLMYRSDPTWGNHNAIFQKAGMKVESYPYYKAETRGFDFEGMLAAIEGMEPNACILLHSCAHNPTGVDPTPAQWEKLIAAIKKQNLVPILDNAYQGYASGDLAKDNLAVQMFEKMGMEFFITQSFAKNFGLYGERIGYVHVLCSDKDRAAAVLSQIKLVVRPMYSSPPFHGARLVNKILTNPTLKAQWMSELKLMATRIVKMRSMLRTELEKLKTPGKWNH